MHSVFQVKTSISQGTTCTDYGIVRESTTSVGVFKIFGREPMVSLTKNRDITFLPTL